MKLLFQACVSVSHMNIIVCHVVKLKASDQDAGDVYAVSRKQL